MRRQLGVLIGVLLAAWLLVPVAEARAQGQQPVTVAISDIPSDILEVATLGANGQKNPGQRGTAPGEFTFSADDFNAGKAVEIWEVTCDDGTRVLILDPAAPLPEGCKKRRRLGAGFWNSGTRLSAAFPSVASGGFSTDLYGLVSFDVTKFTRVGDACATIGERYSAASYTASSCNTDGMDLGYSFGGGATLRFGNRIGLDVNVVYSRAGGPSLDTTGTRTNGNLKFDLSSRLDQTTVRVRVGPTLPVGDRLTVVPFVSLNRYTIEQEYTDSLVAGTPQQRVSGGTTSNSASGFYPGAGVRLECQSWHQRLMAFGEVHYGRLGTYTSNVFGPDAATPWPTNMGAVSVRAGVKVRITNIRATAR